MSTSLAFNAFQAVTNELLAAVSFYTTTDSVSYTVSVFDRFADGQLQGDRSIQTGWFERTGFHTVDLNPPVTLRPGQPFYISLEVSAGGQAFDRTSTVDVLMSPQATEAVGNTRNSALSGLPGQMPFDASFLRTMGKTVLALGTEVGSRSAGGQSYYWAGGQWVDLTNFNGTANFCLKGLTWTRSAIASIRAAPTAVELDVAGLSTGRTYVVQSTTNIVMPVWSNETTFVAAQTTASFTNAQDAAAMKFFRVAR